MQTQFGINLRSEQIGDLKKFGRPLAMEGQSPAMALLKKLQEDPSIRFVCHTAELDAANCITIRNHSKLDFVTLVETPQDSSPSSSPTGQTTHREKFAKAVLDALKLEQGQRLLLCCAWVTDQQVEHFKMHPEVSPSEPTQRSVL
jgi:hypothetical protein